MADSIAAAFAEVDDSELEAVLEPLSRRRAAATPEIVRRAFVGFDYLDISRIVRRLISYYRCSKQDAEEAAHDGLEFMLRKRTDLFAEARDDWLGYLAVWSRYRLLQIRAARRVASVEGLRESSGDSVDMQPIESDAPQAIEDARAASLPRVGEEWSGRQMIGALQRFGDRHWRPPTARECRRIHGLPSQATLRKRWGSFAAALRAAGLSPAREPYRRPSTAAAAAKAYWGFRLAHWRWPEAADLRMNPDSLPSEKIATRYLGSTYAGEAREQVEAILGL